MRLLASVERALRSVVEGAFGRAFGGRVHPAEIAKALLSTAVDGEQRHAGQRHTPNVYVVLLSDPDMRALTPIEAEVQAQLVDALRQMARSEGLAFTGPVRVRFQVSPRLSEGMMQVEATIEEGSPRGHLTVLRGPDAGLVFGIYSAEQTLGRGDAADIRLTDASASRIHARILTYADTVMIEDAGSTNGTHVNHERVPRAELGHGDLVGVGETLLMFEREV